MEPHTPPPTASTDPAPDDAVAGRACLDAVDTATPDPAGVGRPEQIALPLELPVTPPPGEPSQRSTAPAKASGAPSVIAPAGGSRPAEAASDGAHDQPIGFALTARARRAVAPGSLPELSVVGLGPHRRAVDGSGALEEADDTRPARARALRRAGVPVSAIVRQLGADPLAVTAWVGEVGASARSHRDGDRGARAVEAGAAEVTQREQELAVAAQLARAAAAERARQRLAIDPDFGVTIGLLAATASTDAHALTITAADARQVARVLRTLIEEDPEVTAVVRVIVRVGSDLAGDLVRHRVAGELGIDAVQVSWTRWRSAPSADAVQLLVRVAEPSLAATVAGWIDVALEPTPQPLDIAF